jgi:hypothetical protein
LLAEISPNSLTGLLARLGEIINGVLSSRGEGSTAGTGAIGVSMDRILCRERNLEYGREKIKSHKPTDATSTTVAAGGRGLSGEQMLFADDWRVGVRAGHKPKHHIRAYRRTAKKRTAIGAGGQGTLFELDLRRARTA